MGEVLGGQMAHRAALLFVLTVMLSGCGFVNDLTNAATSTQLPPSRLMTQEFYLTATPEQVREEIGSDRLDGQMYSKKHFVRVKPSPEDGEAYTKAKGVFVPTSGVMEQHPDRPLDLALLYSPHTEVIGILLDAGAEVSWDTLELLRDGKLRPEMADALLARGGPELVCDMVELYGTAKDWDSLEECFSKYSAVPDCNPMYRTLTPLMSAAKENNREFAERLLTHGANVNKADSTGLRPLNHALRAGHADMATFLLEKGADSAFVTGAKRRDEPVVTLLNDAKMGGITDAELLKKLAAGVPLTEEAEHAALLVAVEMNSMDLVNQLLERGALFASGEKYYVGKINDIKARQMHAFLEEKGVRVDYSD